MFNKNGASQEYHLKFGINHPRPSEEEVQEFLEEMKRRASDKGMVISEENTEEPIDPNQLSLFE